MTMPRASSKLRRAILHVDMDAFYASVEQLDNPLLRGKPLIVGGTGSRGVVAAASYEVRRFGVHSAMPIRRARQLCPQAICVPPRMARYQQVSQQVFDVFAEFTPLIEGLSLDEAFLDITHSQALLGDAVAIAKTIKARIYERTGLTASVGVAENKLVAKIASDIDKPDGLTIVTAERVQALLDPLPVQRLPGLGRKKGDEIVASGIRTLGELRRASDSRLWPLFGRETARMRERAAGIDDRPVEPDRDAQRISAETTFDRDTGDVALLRTTLLGLADRTAQRLREGNLYASSVQIKIRERDFLTHTRQRRLVPPSQQSQVIGRVAVALLEAWLVTHPGTHLRLLGVGAADLSAPVQPDLFAAARPASGQRLDTVLDEIRGRFGSSAVRRGANIKYDDK